MNNIIEKIKIKKPEKTRKTFWIDKETFDEFKIRCIVENISQGAVVDALLKYFLKSEK